MFGNNRFNAINRHPGYNDPGSILGAGASLASGVLGASAASDAADAQQAAAEQAQALAAQNAVKNDKAFSPYKTLGKAANAKLADYLGLDMGVHGDPMSFAQWRKSYGSQATGAAPAAAASTVFNKQVPYNTGFLGNAGTVTGGAAPVASSAALDPHSDQAAYEAYLANWNNYKPDEHYGSLLKPFTNFDLASDPGYQFRLDQGLKGINNAATARGGYDSGATLKALNQYNQDYAAGEFGNAFNRDAANKNSIYNFLGGSADRGLNATNANASVNNGLTSSMIQSANANGQNQANAAIAGGQAWNNAIQGGIGNYLYGQRTQPANSSIFGGGGFGNNGGTSYTHSIFS